MEAIRNENFDFFNWKVDLIIQIGIWFDFHFPVKREIIASQSIFQNS